MAACIYLQHSDEEKLSIHKLTHIHTEDVKI